MLTSGVGTNWAEGSVAWLHARRSFWSTHLQALCYAFRYIHVCTDKMLSERTRRWHDLTKVRIWDSPPPIERKWKTRGGVLGVLTTQTCTAPRTDDPNNVCRFLRPPLCRQCHQMVGFTQSKNSTRKRQLTIAKNIWEIRRGCSSLWDPERYSSAGLNFVIGAEKNEISKEKETNKKAIREYVEGTAKAD